MGTESIEFHLMKAKTAYINLSPMVRGPAGAVFNPIISAIEQLSIELRAMKQAQAIECEGQCAGCGADCPARGQ